MNTHKENVAEGQSQGKYTEGPSGALTRSLCHTHPPLHHTACERNSRHLLAPLIVHTSLVLTEEAHRVVCLVNC